MKYFFTLILVAMTISQSFAQCNELFFSEYIEGTSNNRALEIYNPTASPINLIGYKVTMKGFNNSGNPTTGFFNLNGTIPAFGTYVMCNDGALAPVKAAADTIIVFTPQTPMSFGGDDAIVLTKSGKTIDQIGNRFATDRSQVDSPFMKDQTLVRKTSITMGDTTDWFTSGKNGWTSFVKDYQDLHIHACTCAGPIDTLAKFSFPGRSVEENAGTISVQIKLNYAYPTMAGATVVLSMGDAADINNFIGVPVVFLPGKDTVSAKITITDDAIAEYKETLKLSLRMPMGGIKIGKDSIYTIVINMSDLPAVELPIATIRGNNNNGIPDSFDKTPVIVRGIVLGTDQDNNANGVRFTLYDNSVGTDGIQASSNANNFGNYIVTEGDSVLVTGKVNHFNGLATLDITEFTKLGTAVAKKPRVVSILDESSESDLVRMNDLTYVSGAWPATDMSTNITVKDASGKNQEIRIQNFGGSFGAVNILTGVTFHVIGIGGQFDVASANKIGGFQLIPRMKSDIIIKSAISEIKTILNVSIVPNPNNGLFNLNYDATTSTPTTIKVFNTMMQEVANYTHTSTIGANTVSMNLNNYAKGTYFVELHQNGGQKVVKMIVE
jgi:hypothetical protein